MNKIAKMKLGIIGLLVLIGIFSAILVFADDTGATSPGTVADDDSIGTEAWIDAYQAKVSDNLYTIPMYTSTTIPGVIENSIKIVKGGVISGDDKSTGASLPTEEDTYISYGGSSDLWGETWTAEDINNVNFGVVASFTGDQATTHYLKATNFGFDIPTGAIIDGILVEIDEVVGQVSSWYVSSVDHIRITVYYTLDTTDPVTNFYLPDNATSSSSLSQTFIFNQTDNVGLANSTLHVWNSSGGRIITSDNESTGPNSPNILVNYSSVIGIANWSNPNYANSSDDTRATVALRPDTTNMSHYLKATNFSFSIPAGATIHGIFVEIEKGNTPIEPRYLRDEEVKIVKADGTLGSENKADTTTPWPAPDAYVSYGNSTDLWGESWTAEDINDVDFGVVLMVFDSLNPMFTNIDTAHVDHFRITVYYTGYSSDDITGISNSTSWSYTFSSDDTYSWNAETCDQVGNCAFNSTNRTITIDTTEPIITLPVYTNATHHRNDQNLIFNISVSDVHASYCSINVADEANQTLAVSSGWCNGTYVLTGIADGNKTINAYANDTVGNIGLNDSYVVWLDSTPPISTPTAKSPPSGASYTFDTWTNTSVEVTIIGSDTGVGVDTFNFPVYCNDTENTCTPSIWIEDGVTISTEGTSYIRFYSNDTLDNKETTQSKIIKIDSTNPAVSSLTETPTDPATYSYGGIYLINATVTDTNLDVIILEFDGVNYTATNLAGDIYNVTFIDLAVGTYDYRWYANDTLGNMNGTESSSYTIDKAIPTGSLTGETPITYGTAGDVEGTESNDGDGGCIYKLYRNGTEVLNPDTTTLGADTYNYIYNTTGCANYSTNASIDTFDLIVNKATPTASLTNDRDWTFTFNGTPANIGYSESNNGDGGVTYKIYVDSSDEGSSYSQAEVGVYTVILNTTGGANYSAVASMDSNTLTINQAIPVGSLTSTNGWTIDYLQGTTIGISESNIGDGDVNYTVYRDEVFVMTGAINLSAGNYDYLLNTTGGTNYTANASMDAQTLTVNKISSQTSLTFDIASPQIYGTAITPTCSVLTGEGSAVLKMNGTTITSGVAITIGADTYSFNCSYAATTNYTASENVSSYIINKAMLLGSLTSDLGWTINETQEVVIELSESNSGDSDVVYVVYRDGVNKTTGETWSPVYGTYDYVLNSTGGVNWTSNASIDSQTLTVNDIILPIISIVYPQNISYNVNVSELNYTYTETNPDKCWWSNNSGVWNSTLQTCGTNWTSLTSIEGSNTWTIYMNDTSGNENSTSITFFKDTVIPQINIVYPTNITYAINVSELNYTYTEVNPSRCWYSNDSGVTNSSDVSCGTNFTDVISMEGSNTWILYMNDTVGNENSTSITFFKDSIIPLISYNPSTDANDIWKQTGDIFINITASDSNKDTIEFEFDGTNETFANSDGNLYWENKTGLSTGNYSFYAWINDSASNFNSTSVRTVRIDLENPVVDIIEPQTQNYNVNISLELNYTVSDTNLHSCWWNIDDGSNTTLTGCTNTTFNTTEDTHIIKVYANDSSGRETMDSVEFTVNLAPPSISLDYPSNNTWLDYSQNVDFNYTPSDTDGISTCQLWINSTETWHLNQSDTSPVNGATNTFYIDLTDSSYIWNVWCNDTGDNGAWGDPIANHSVNVDTIYPLISYETGTADNDTNSTNTWLFVNISATELNFVSITYRLYNDVGSYNITTYTSLITTINWTNLPDDVYYYNVTVVDSASNENSTITRLRRLDDTKPTIVIDIPQVQNYATNDSMKLNYTAADNLIGLDRCWYYILYTNGTVAKSTETLSSCENDTFSLPGGDNDFTLTLFAQDLLANTQSSHVTFGIRTESPAISLVPVNDTHNNYLNNHRLNFSVLTNADSISTCELWGNFTGTWVKNQTMTAVSTVVENSFDPINLSEDKYDWNVWCNDSLDISGWGLNNQTYIIDVSAPNISISVVTTSRGVQTFTFNTSVTDNYFSSTVCKYSIYDSGGGIDGLNENVSFVCNQLKSATVTAYGTFTLKTYATDKATNENSTNSSFTVSAAPPGNGGGGGVVIVGVNETAWSMTTTTGTEKYEIYKIAGVSKSWDILFQNLGESERTITLSIENVQGSLYVFVEFEKDTFELPVVKDVSIRNTFTINFPEEITSEVDVFNIVAIDELGQPGSITVEARKGSIVTETTFKLFTSIEIFGIKIPYALIFIFVVIGTGVLSFKVIFKKLKKRGFISIITGLVCGFIFLVLF